ncbi:MAG: hypothetical protein ACTH0C_07415 [Actinomycetaceae bacterium]
MSFDTSHGWTAPENPSGPALDAAPVESIDTTSETPRPARTWRRNLVVAAIALVAFGAGAGIAIGTADPTASDEYAQIDDRLNRVVVERDGLRDDLAASEQSVQTLTGERDQALEDLDAATSGSAEREAGLDERESGLDERESGLDTREAGLDERETAVADRETDVSDREVAVGTAEERLHRHRGFGRHHQRDRRRLQLGEVRHLEPPPVGRTGVAWTTLSRHVGVLSLA